MKFADEPEYVEHLYGYEPDEVIHSVPHQVDWYGLYRVDEDLVERFPSLDGREYVIIHEDNFGFVGEVELIDGATPDDLRAELAV